ncbi:MAG: TonB-dependent receptor [Bacteroidales bacterium]|nr:TonB-dependent receptor [Bacteroidales bacterium]MBN2817518.1 TonB-dependent receptor [Bacteroidales bacterium]
MKLKIKVFLFSFGFSLFSSFLFSQITLLDTVYITKHYNQESFIQLISDLEAQFPIRFFFDEGDEILTNLVFSEEINHLNLSTVVSRLLDGTAYSFIYIPKGNIVILPKHLNNISNVVQENQNKEMLIGDVRERGKHRTAKLSGKIVDGKTGKPVIGAVVYSVVDDKGAVSNINGEYNIELKAGKHMIKYSIVGFESQEKEIELVASGDLNIELFEESIELTEVIVTRKRPDKNVSQAQMSTIEINAKELLTIPTLMGETDLIKSMTLMPGVQTVGEAASGFNIRGGNIDQNLILIEDVPIFNTAHLFGFFSTIHPGVVSNVTLYKGNVPANFGGRISSVMDIGVKDGNIEKPDIEGGIGFINARATIEVPIIKNKLSIVAGGRSTYSDWILKRMPDVNLKESTAGYYDLIAKIKWSINKKNSISVFGYKSNDDFDFASTSRYTYGNQLANVRYNKIFSSRLSISALASLSKYKLKLESEKYVDDPEAMRIRSEIQLLNTRFNITYLPFIGNTVDIGFEGNQHQFSPGAQEALSKETFVSNIVLESEHSKEWAFYISDNYEITNWLSINGGIRYSFYQYLGAKSVFEFDPNSPKSASTIIDTNHYIEGDKIVSYNNPEPRLALRFSIDQKSSVKLGFNASVQYLQLLSNTSAATPTDVWKLADQFVLPLKSKQYSLGYFRNFSDNTIEASAEVYFKQIENLIDYKNGATIVMNETIETDIVNGKGKAYGLELFIRKNSGTLTGWIGYTFSRTLKNTISDFTEELINRGEYYPAAYDKPHDITASLNYKLSRRWSVSGNFTYSSGRPVTLPEYQFEIDGRKLVYFSDRNKYRLPDYHRLDLSISYHGHLKAEQNWKSSWSLSVFNVYGRNNPYSVYYTKDQPTAANNYKYYVLYKLSVVNRPIPTITYNFKF